MNAPEPNRRARLHGWLRRGLTRRRLIAASITLILLGAAKVWVAWDAAEPYRTEAAMLTVLSGPGRTERITLDTTLYLPETATKASPAPAVLLAHGFGGTKASVAASAKELAGRGYVVLSWSARGFGRSGGQIALDDPDHEVNDARALIDVLADRSEVRQDKTGDPRVGIVGGSYGGALALLVAAYDSRVDAIVPQITWHNLAEAFFPESSGREAVDGVFKRGWAGLFFGSGSGLSPEVLLGRGGTRQLADVQCGRFSREICNMYLKSATTGHASNEAIALLERRSPAGVLARIKAPTLLIQGQADTLFPLAEADANARGIAAGGTPVRVAWYSGGHDGTGSDADVDRTKFLTVQWLDHYLRGTGAVPAASFTYSMAGGISARSSRATTLAYVSAAYPGVTGTKAAARLPLAGPPQRVANPPDGTPAAISSLSGVGQLSALTAGLAVDVPGQFATFQAEPFDAAVDVVGTPTVQIKAASPTGEAVLFVKLYDVASDGRSTLPGNQVAVVRLTGLESNLDKAKPVAVTLSAIAHRFEAGHRARLVVATSDQGYSTPVEPVVYQVGLGNSPLTLPRVDASPVATTAVLWQWVLAGLLALVAVGVAVVVLVVRVRHRRIDRTVRADAADTPLVIEGLRKAYGDGFLAVRELSFRVERGQVVGLLGPNGAGKTTALRMLMGLIWPTAGEILVFGHRVNPGAPVLSRLGAFVEGSGFLPHLSGADNLRRYWQATGRPAQDAHVEEALAIAGLGSAINRRVKTYSQGMRQRLAIAQAMLGLPDLLVLDEPTNGLDPPQMREMRDVLRRYATDGRTVLVSSHLLAEVEQVCSHVVVMHKGELVAAGPVEEIVGESTSVLVEITGDMAAAVKALNGVQAVTAVQPNGAGMVVELIGAEPGASGSPRSEVVRALVAAGIGVERIAPKRRLEDVFLTLVGEDR